MDLPEYKPYCPLCRWRHSEAEPHIANSQVLDINSLDPLDPYAEDLLDEATKDLMEERDGRYR